MGYSRERRLRYIQQGLCGSCGRNPLVVAKKECEECALKRKTWQKKQYHKKWGRLTSLKRKSRIKKGLCGRCGKRPFLADKKHCESCLNAQRESLKRYKDIVFEAYGGYKCSCCGETIEGFLTLDHIANDGAEHRKTLKRSSRASKGLYLWIIRNNFPKMFQVLCWNCNCGKRMNGGVCPHKG